MSVGRAQIMAMFMALMTEQLCQILLGPDVDFDLLQRLIKNPEKLRKALQKFVSPPWSKEDEVYLVTEYNKKRVEKLIQAGEYDSVDPRITSRVFPPREWAGAEEMSWVVLFYSNREVTTEEAIREMDRFGFLPSDHPEFLAFGAKYPNVQRRVPIVALRAICSSEGERFALWLGALQGARRLLLRKCETPWSPGTRFAAVGKAPPRLPAKTSANGNGEFRVYAPALHRGPNGERELY